MELVHPSNQTYKSAATILTSSSLTKGFHNKKSPLY